MKPLRFRTLCDMFTYCRPYDGRSVQQFANRYLAPLPNATMDAFGNYHVPVGDSTILWSCHTDTVHRHDGYQTIHVDAGGTIGLSKRSGKRSSCLGADDTVGVFLMREMILANVPGYYVFHHGEESGGIGSRQLAKSFEATLKRFTAAIALDRGGCSDIITWQSGGRCCSDTFATSLAAGLNMTFKPCDGGIYTDTAEYTHLIPECTNVSVGYHHAHSRLENVNIHFIDTLLAALLQLDPSTLIIERDPSVIDDWHDYVDDYLWHDDDIDDHGINWKYRDSPLYLDPAYEAVQRELDRREKAREEEWWTRYFLRRESLQ